MPNGQQSSAALLRTARCGISPTLATSRRPVFGWVPARSALTCFEGVPLVLRFLRAAETYTSPLFAFLPSRLPLRLGWVSSQAIQQTAEPSFNSRSANVEAPAEDQEESRDCKARPAAAEAKPEASMHGRQHRRKRKSKRLGIRSLLRRFFDPQKLELRCERCSGNQVRVETRLQRLPRVLVLHLKRLVT